jgi:hypothetical protein
MRRPILSRTLQGELFPPLAKLPELPAEVRQKMARGCWMLKEYLQEHPTVARQEVGNE